MIRGEAVSRSASVGVLRSLLLAPLPLLLFFLASGDCSILCFHSSSLFIDSSRCREHINR